MLQRDTVTYNWNEQSRDLKKIRKIANRVSLPFFLSLSPATGEIYRDWVAGADS